ncbi:MAG: adenylate kinase [Anaerolineae bacterium]|nr:MAG: adenylate kinase [Anaerolineae bacterium]
MAKRVVMLGPPGAGKGTQAKRLAKHLGVPHVSSGDIFRENLREKTELGRTAEAYMKRGELVPDDVTIAMIRERLSRPDCREGVVLDGFPRTPAQAEALDAMLQELYQARVDLAPLIEVPEEVLVERLTGRRSCPNGHVYHLTFNPPKEAGKCDHDGLELFQREDDRPETVLNRIQVYNRQTQPLIDFYDQRGVLARINGNQPIEAVSAELFAALEKA